MNLLPIPAFSDNYIWLLHDAGQALVVDPGDAAPVLATLHRLGLQLQGILVTHHHADHVGGVAQLHQATGAQVWGPAYEQLPEPVQRVQGGDTVQALGGPWQVIDVPGHTSGHIAFYSTAAQAQPVLFCGDTLFSGGCGRLFEGTAQQMQQSLDDLASLPGNTLVCCAHEYTMSNLRFAQAVEPNNETLAHYQRHCQALREAGRPTLPSLMETERSINPFLRTRESAVAAAAAGFDAQVRQQDPASVLAGLRQWKNVF
ncbi:MULTISPECIES: hydroxyacylglutathione hydrolase [Delftia]|uniref:Hydroxyacylglutathione hydrolase n=1 Tax=Delftia lacustris TaxID=558537 RepID=A0A1H3K9I1_9BURK|nr:MULTISPECIES: hydroxyacylglutathione hydrolase [Delftia]MCO5337220.1 hydroxyacylglutathione hydrolase [Delftia tsuruhatensis]MCR4545945.1 hydroxyacylglutathione hydrolase [Delftia tsuruhatensis]MCX7504319.1 hydroxyacylglutathione hydrolase [Delftia tsuruhatensis]SDY48445.1 hydroxyacylglutathione hydrolase [Delftia lacustris]